MLRIKAFLLIIIIFQSSSGEAAGFTKTVETKSLTSKVNHNARKILRQITLDYDYGGANSRHDPRKGRPGIGGRST